MTTTSEFTSDHERVLQALNSLQTSSTIHDTANIAPLRTIDEVSVILARVVELRKFVGITQPSIWPALGQVWKTLQGFETQGELEEVTLLPTTPMSIDQDLQIYFASVISIARFTRNLCAQVPINQEKAVCNETHIRTLLHRYTSFGAISDSQSFAMVKMLIQTIANIVTGNESLVNEVWDMYMDLPEERNILIRLLAHPDSGIVASTLIFITNCIALNEENARMQAFAIKPTGIRMSVVILDKMNEDADAPGSDQVFMSAYQLFVEVFRRGFGPTFMNTMGLQEEPITPQQTTLFKTLDSYLVDLPPDSLQDAPQVALFTTVTQYFFQLSEYAVKSMQASVEHGGPVAGEMNENAQDSLLQRLDLLLPKVCEALVVITHCLCTFVLPDDEDRKANNGSGATVLRLNHRQIFRTAMSPRAKGSVETVIDLLRLLDQFVPRLTLVGKMPAANPNQVPSQAPPSGHAWVHSLLANENTMTLPQPSDPRRALVSQSDGAATVNDNSRGTETRGFNFIKRALVRLVGILVHRDKATQDRVRACGGIQVILNLCVLDDRNPYLREHSLFAVRNLLEGNAENQKFVEELKFIEGREGN